MIKQYKCHIVFILIIFFFYFIIYNSVFYFFFFFQAEDGIRDLYVTGVDVCSSDLPAKAINRSAAHGCCSRRWFSPARAPRSIMELFSRRGSKTRSAQLLYPGEQPARGTVHRLSHVPDLLERLG